MKDLLYMGQHAERLQDWVASLRPEIHLAEDVDFREMLREIMKETIEGRKVNEMSKAIGIDRGILYRILRGGPEPRYSDGVKVIKWYVEHMHG